MTLTNFDGGFNARMGMGTLLSITPVIANVQLDAANEASIYIGHVITSDGASHTIDTTGSSSLNWRTAAVTFANAGTTVKVGIGNVDAATGPPGRAANAADVITMDVFRSMTGGGGGVTANAWQTHVPTSGTKTIANGDLVAFSVQMTARGGADSVQVSSLSLSDVVAFSAHTSFLGGSYAATTNVPNCMIVFSDGARGWIYGSDVLSSLTTTTWNSGSAQVEHGQLFKIPFPLKIYGLYGTATITNDLDVVLYSDPLGTPVAQKTVAIDANTVPNTSARRWQVLFPAPYTTTADQLLVASYKPGAGNLSVVRKTIGAAADRVTEIFGTDGYGVSRASGGGAFSDFNSSLDHFYIGLIVGAFDNGAGSGGRSIKINDGSAVA